MDTPRFNRHEQMDSATRSRILDLISDLSIIENCNPNSVINMLYGAFDGYDYSDLILADRLLTQLENGGNGHITKEITDIAYIIKAYEKTVYETI